MIPVTRLRVLRPLMPLVLVAVLVAVLLSLVAAGDPAARFVLAAPLFQSPVSPVNPDLPMQMEASPEDIATLEAEQAAAQPAQPPAQPTQPPAQVQPQPPPAQAAPVQIQPTPAPPQAQPPAAQPVQPVQPPPPPPPASEPGDGEVIIDNGLLIDSILVYFSYAWLCCGVLAFILIPLVFLGLYVWGSRRNRANGKV